MALVLGPLPVWLGLDERRAERRAVAFDTIMAEGTAPGAVAVRMEDLSRFGCRLSVPASTTVGRTVTVTLPSSITIEGVIAWFEGGRAGLDFLRPLPAELVDRLTGDRGMADRAG